jgi:hypothetical protein
MTKPIRNYGSLSFWITSAVYILMIVCAWYISSNLSVNGFVAKENAVSILKSLLDIDIALIAFFGLVLVFHLNYINGVKDRTAREKHETSIQRDTFQLNYLTRFDGMSSDTLPSFQKVYSEIYEKYTKRIEELEKEFQALVLQMAGVSMSAIITVAFIFADILLNVFFLGAMTIEGLPFMNLFFDLLVLLLVLYCITTSLIFLQPKTERAILIKELKRLWVESQQKRKSSKKPAEGE